MRRSSPSLWYAWAAVLGVVAALLAVMAAHFWISIGIDPWLEAHGVPSGLGHGVLSSLVIVLIGVAARRVGAPH
jgi:hypothetical protein